MINDGRVPCALCGDLLWPHHPGTFYEVAGWVQRRAGGGVHQLALRRELGRWAHSGCVSLSRSRASTGDQLGLFAEGDTP